MQKNILLFLSLVLSLALIYPIFGQDRVETEDFILKIDQISPNSTIPTIPWLKSNTQPWHNEKPTFDIKHNSSELAAKGWVAMTNEHLLLKIIVQDDIHLNNNELSNIWNGDAIQIGIDPQGQGSGDMPNETPGMIGPDDAGLGFAIGKNGAEGFAWFLGSNWVSTPLNKSVFKISREEKKKTTTYEIAVSWASLNTKPGTFPYLGLAVQINDNDPRRTEQDRISWGQGAGGNATPGLFEKLAYGNPLSDFTSSYKLNQELWKVNDCAEMCFTVASKNNFVLNANLGSKSISKLIKGNQNFTANRYSVKLIAKKLTKPFSFEASLIEENTKKNIEQQKITTAIPELTIIDFFKRIDSLISIPTNHPLFLKHLYAVKSLVMIEWAKKNIYQQNTRALKESFKFIYNINEGLKGEAGKWESYLANERTLTMAYISKKDGTLQYYSLDLPKNWNQSATYPLFMELHGSGNENPIATLNDQLSSSVSTLDLHGYTSTKSYIQKVGLGYHIAPFGRGNSRYKDIGEVDVFEAYDDVHNLFNIDETRRYLYGFSMGGGGTWSIGLRTPDKWAAICIFAGGLWNEKPSVDIAKNAINTPVFIWCGEQDDLFSNLLSMQKKLIEVGIKPEIRTTKGLGHNYPDSIQALGINYLIKFTRKRPSQFSFIADKEEHLGIWGISMTRDESISGIPSFDCTIDGQTIKIISTGTKGLKINMGEKGLKMTGNVIVFWNGKKEYEGVAKDLTLGEQIIDEW